MGISWNDDKKESPQGVSSVWIVEDEHGPVTVGERKDLVLSSFGERILWERYDVAEDEAERILALLRDGPQWAGEGGKRFRLMEWIPKGG